MKKLALVLAVMMMALTLFVSCGEQEPELTTADLVKATWNLTKIVATDGTETVIEAVDSFSYSLGENGTGIATEGDSAYDITYVVSENNITVNDSGESMPLVYDAENDQLVFTDPDDGSKYIFTK
ncbi:MAG TPA: hypothetical protein H9681_03955 [Firmicutes bacterium]|nr:hypothetical protein [Bacillota bacterium]